jgi:hypothetical protein
MNTSTKTTLNEAECGNKSKPLLAVVFPDEAIEELAHKSYPWGSENSIGSRDRSFYEKRKIAFIEGFKAGLNYR